MIFANFYRTLSDTPSNAYCYDENLGDNTGNPSCKWKLAGMAVSVPEYPGCRFTVTYETRTCINSSGESETQINILGYAFGDNCNDAINDIWPSGTTYNGVKDEILYRPIFREVTNKDFDRTYHNTETSQEQKDKMKCKPDTPEQPCGTGQTAIYSYYQGTCMSQCIGYKYIPGWEILKNYSLNCESYLLFDYNQTSGQLTISVDNSLPIVVFDPILKNKVIVNGELIINYPFKWWWPFSDYYRLQTVCSNECCVIKRTLCWCESQNECRVSEVFLNQTINADCSNYPIPALSQCDELENRYSSVTFDRIISEECKPKCTP